MNHNLKILGGVVAAFTLVTAAVQAQDALTSNPAEVTAGAYVLDPAHSKITWSVDHMGFSTYIGQFTGVDARLTIDPDRLSATALTATVRTDTVGTFHDGLDAHLKNADFLDVSNHPTATFRSTSVKRTGASTADITGDLTLRGVTRPVTLEAEFNQAGVNPLDKTYTLGFDGKAVIKRSDFGVSYGLPAVGDEVTLNLAAEFKLVPAGGSQ